MPQIPNLKNIKRFYKKVEVVEHPQSDDLPKLPSNEEISLNNISLSHDKYWAVALDGRVTKTMYKDVLAFPTRALAVACAEEWDSQHDKVNLKSLHLNQMLAKAIRAAQDPTLAQYMRNTVQLILEND